MHSRFSVPTDAIGNIRFGTIDASRSAVTNVEATEGSLLVSLYKTATGALETPGTLRLAYFDALRDRATQGQMYSLSLFVLSAAGDELGDHLSVGV